MPSDDTAAPLGEPRWVLDQRNDVWARWLSDGLYHQGSRTASLADVVKHYGPVQVLTLGRVIRDGEEVTRAT